MSKNDAYLARRVLKPEQVAPRLSAEEFKALQVVAEKACGGPGPAENLESLLALFKDEALRVLKPAVLAKKNSGKRKVAK